MSRASPPSTGDQFRPSLGDEILEVPRVFAVAKIILLAVGSTEYVIPYCVDKEGEEGEEGPKGGSVECEVAGLERECKWDCVGACLERVKQK